MNTSLVASLIADSLAWALLHSLWQGLVIYVLLFMVLKAVNRASAGLKYYLSLGGFAAIFTWFIATWTMRYNLLEVIRTRYAGASGMASTFIRYADKNGKIQIVQPAPASHVMPDLERFSSLFITLYLIGLLLMMVRFGINIYQLKTLRTKDTLSPGNELDELMKKWLQKFSVSRPVKLLLSARVSAPVMLGTIKPLILLPVATINHLSMEQLEAIIVHELSHIRRHDYLINILQTIAETVLFFNPFIWLISAIIRKEREHCCDDLVIANTQSPIPYANALAILEINRVHNGLSLAATGQKNQLLNRIKRITEMKKTTINYSQLGIITIAVIAITFALVAFTPSFAQKHKLSRKNTVTNRYTYTTAMNGKDSAMNITGTITEEGDIKDGIEVYISFEGEKETYKYKGSLSGLANDPDRLEKAVKEIVNTIKSTECGWHGAVAGIEINEDGKPNKKGERKEPYALKVQLEKDEQYRMALKTKMEAEKAAKEAMLVKQKAEQALAKAEQEREEISEEEGKVAMHVGNETTFSVKDKPNTKILIESKGSRTGINRTIMKMQNMTIYTDSTNFDPMLDKMHKEGLLSSKEFTVKKINDELFINGVKQPQNIYDEYKDILDFRTIVFNSEKDKLTIEIVNWTDKKAGK